MKVKKIALALALAALGAAAHAQDAEGTVQGEVVFDGAQGSINTESNVNAYPKDPESVGKLLGVYIAGVPPTLEFCGWGEARVKPIQEKADRIIALTYGTLPPAHQVLFARGFFEAIESHGQYLAILPEQEKTKMCNRLDKEEHEMTAALEARLRVYEPMVEKGQMKAADIYEGRFKP